MDSLQIKLEETPNLTVVEQEKNHSQWNEPQPNRRIVSRFRQLWNQLSGSVNQRFSWLFEARLDRKNAIQTKLVFNPLEDRNAPGNMLNGLGGIALGVLPGEALERMFSIVGENAFTPPLHKISAV